MPTNRRVELSEFERKELTRPANAGMTAHRPILSRSALSRIVQSLTRNTMSLVTFAVIGASICGCGSQKAPVPSALGSNIILIVVDTLRADHLGVYGYSRDTSPNIDAFARDALLFRRAYTPLPKTAPAMASLFTSSPPHVHGVRKVPQAMPEGVMYIPEELRRHGYTTAAVVSNPVAGRAFGFHRGFDVWKQIDKDIGRKVTDKALEVLGALNGKDDGPFFLWVHYHKPHAPYQPSPEYHSMFVGDALWAEEDVSFSEDEFGAFGTIPQVAKIDGNNNPHYYVAEYDAAIRDVDSEVGRLLGELRTRGLYDSSLIVLTADHGESLGEHNYYFEHGMFPYDVNGHVPLAIRHPEREPAVTDVPASLVDLLPTLLKAAELPVPEAAMGIDLFAAVDAEDTNRLIFAESGYGNEPQVSVRRNGWKLIHIPSVYDRKRLTGGLYELYNTDEDPLEERNLAGQGLAVEAALAESLNEWVATWDEDSLPEVRTPEVSQETWDQLRALGYVHTKKQVIR